ncbi:MAG: CsgG/HfaB family protein [Armatimonadota bacterium]|nr:CsgG/HfaB family protein [Armatimonadota bacterium]
MKAMPLGLVFLLVLVALVTPLPAQDLTTQPRIAVLPFGWGSCSFMYPACDDRAATITNMVEEAFFRLRRYRLVDRRALLAILQEQGLSASQLVNPQTAAEAGRLAGAQLLITGVVDRMTMDFVMYAFGVQLYQASVALTARAVRTEDAEVVAIARVMKANRGTPAGGLATRGLPLFEYTAQQAVDALVQEVDRQLQTRR